MKLKALFLILLVSFPAFAQTGPTELPFAVSGTVLDSENGAPLQYVTVTIPGTRYSTVSNSDGGFIIKSATKAEGVEFSLLGYKTARVTISDEKKDDLTVRLVRKNLTLNQSMVISGDPYQILREAVAKIPVNYPSEPELFDCFYRETIQKRQRFIFISEAVTKMFKTPYSQNTQQDRVMVEKSRILNSPRKRDTLSVTVVGGPTQGVTLDVVKDRSFFSPDNLSLYVLEMEAPVMIDDRMQYAIRMIPGTDADYALYSGVIYIDSESLSFTRLDLALDMRDKQKATEMMLVKKPLALRFTPLEMSLQFNYSLSDGVSRVSYVRTIMRFKCDWKKKLIKTDYTAVSELVTTDRQSGDVARIPYKASFKAGESLAENSSLDYDSGFWKDYNIIEPTESLDRAIGKIKKQTE